MNSLPTTIRRSLRSMCSLGACASIATVLFFAAAPTASAAPATLSLKPKVVAVSGSATTTLTSLEYNADGTISIEAAQVGHLSQFGDFTGHLSYLAIPSPTSILLRGTATLTNKKGEQLHLFALILELGTDYPYTATGVLTVTGGTGRYAGATGLIVVTGYDTESPTDTLNLQGTLVLEK